MSRIPFDKAEITEAKMVEGRRGPTKLYKYPITPKENYKLFYKKENPYWIPLASDILMLTPRIDADNIARCFCFEANPLPPEEFVGGKDKFGVDWVYVPVAGGSMVKPGSPTLADVNDWKRVIKFPDVDSWDWETARKTNADHVNTDKFVQGMILTGYFERLISFMDFEMAALAIIDEDQKDAVHELFDKISDMHIKMVDHYIDVFKIDILCLHDDWGGQRSPFFSLATAREMLVPHIKKVVDYCHSRGIFFELHSCGKNELLVPAYIDMGIDSWSGQPMNDKAMLYEKYGDQVILGIEPDCVPALFPYPPIPAEESLASAKRFVEKYCKQFPKKSVLIGGFFGQEEFNDYMYETTRKMFA